MILAIDPGTHAGWAMFHNGNRTSGTWCFETLKATKKRKAEPKHYRLKKMIDALGSHCEENGYPDLIVCEDAAGFTRGKAAVEASHKYRAVVEIFCSLESIPLGYVQPADVKRFATGKGNADKTEMLNAAKVKYGYDGTDDNEADAILIREWAITNNPWQEV